MSVTDTLFVPLLRSGPARPLITHYDDAAGSRVELSAATLGNWAAKTANWLVDELDVAPGDPVAVMLPAHWQTAGILLGAWWCGARVVADPAGAAVALVTRDMPVGAAHATAVVSLDPMGRDLGAAHDGAALDFIAEARLHGDDFVALQPVPGDTPALLESTVDGLVETARARAAVLGIQPGARALSTLDWTLPDGVIDGLLAILAAGASLVQVSHPDPAAMANRRQTERTTLDLSADQSQ